ncbi:hypothetical protein BDV26DRAFT_291366 [Aspergillus bertholletiae]|uniref:Uncharacterized protein n=1 Tax=Aspergillus bertholletiae TaxID=1226010 RepID=A0A5N7BC53_9EURO|nr:hypothetical protein BDV26DRAFT_291366 [Aspergillus bertholletiae]
MFTEQTITGAQQTPTDGPEAPESSIPLEWEYGPVKVTGWVATDTLDGLFSPSIMGISLGNLEGNMKDGIRVKFALSKANGALVYYLKNGNEIWARLDIDVVFNGSYHDDFKLCSF